jgi:rubrerythrin
MDNILEEAVDFELEGISLYLELREKAKNELAIKLFDSLVAQEKEHVDYIKQYTMTKKFKPLATTLIQEQIRALFDTLSDDQKKDKLSNLEGYELALQLETKGYDLYKKAFENAANEEDKQFFEFLMKMEKDHYESLANVYYYFSDNSGWLSENESQTWNWMNL